MNRQQKVEVVDLLKNDFEHSKASFLIGFSGLSVAQMQDLRRQLHKNGGHLKVAKARLMKRAVQDLEGAQELAPFFKNQVGLVFADNEAAAIAKVLNDFAKKNEALSLVVGCMDSRILDKSSIVRVASLPSREVLLAQLCGTLKMPMVNVVSVCNMQMLKLLWTLKQVQEKKAVA